MAKSPSELTPQTLIKRVMSGTTTNSYLLAFSKLSSTDLHHPDFNRHDIIRLWNSLQKTPGKVRYFTFSLVDNNHCVQRRIKERFDSVKWAWICHDKDTSAERKHYHYYLEFQNPRSFASIANDLELPVTMLEKVYNKKGILQYLTHENDPNKHHYDKSEIVSNFDVDDEIEGGGKPDLKTFWQKYKQMRSGVISGDDFIEWLNRVYCATLEICGKDGCSCVFSVCFYASVRAWVCLCFCVSARRFL